MASLGYKHIFLWGLALGTHALCGMTNLTSNDPYPIYTTADPHNFLNIREKQALKGYEVYGAPERAQISISGYRQSASTGSTVNREDVELGDLTGRWNVLGLFFPEPDGSTAVEQLLLSVLNITQAEKDKCFNSNPGADEVNLADPSNSDVNKEFGFFTVPIKYRKAGLRFDIDIDLVCGFAFKIQGGVADLRQTATFVDLTCSATGLACPTHDPAGTGDACVNETCCIDIFTCECKKLVIDKIMKQFDSIITPTLGLNASNYHTVGAEDTRLTLYWRRMYEINRLRPSWARFIITPFLEAEVAIPTGKKGCPHALFALPLGNDGHWGYGFNGGFTIDWVDTVEIGFEASMTKFHSRRVCDVPVPTHELQSGVFPRLATLIRSPGTNWAFMATLSAYHFLDRLSFWFQYAFVNHDQDCFTILSTNAGSASNIILKKMIANSKWESQVANVGFNYDISPNIALGVLWQAPLRRRNAYRSTTIMGSIVVSF